jgi:hypothetical protein
MIAVALWQRARQRPARARELTREQWARIRDEKELAIALEDLLARVDEVARRVGADLESRQAALRALIEAADLRIASLRADEDVIGTKRRHPEPQPSATTPRIAPAAAVGELPVPTRLDERQQRIFELADAGADPGTTADALQMPVGEVELVLNMRQFSQSPRP